MCSCSCSLLDLKSADQRVKSREACNSTLAKMCIQTCYRRVSALVTLSVDTTGCGLRGYKICRLQTTCAQRTACSPNRGFPTLCATTRRSVTGRVHGRRSHNHTSPHYPPASHWQPVPLVTLIWEAPEPANSIPS